MARDEAVHDALAARETEFARQTARMDRELAVQPSSSAAAAATDDVDENDDDDNKRTTSGLGLETDAVSE